MREFEIPKPPPGWFCWGHTIYACEDDPDLWSEDLWYAVDDKDKPSWCLDVGGTVDDEYGCQVIRWRPVCELFTDPKVIQEVVEHNKLTGPRDTIPDWEHPYAWANYRTAEEVVAWIGRWFDKLGGDRAGR